MRIQTRPSQQQVCERRPVTLSFRPAPSRAEPPIPALTLPAQRVAALREVLGG